MTILALDPGLSLAHATFDLSRGRLTLLSYGTERIPGNPKGNAGRERVFAWAAEILSRFEADEVCSDSEILQLEHTNVAALGAFEAARAFARPRGWREDRGKVRGSYPRWVYWNDCANLAGVWQPCGLKRWKPEGIHERRAVLARLTGYTLSDCSGDRRHSLDAIACGLCHAHRQHNWAPDNWVDPREVARLAEIQAAIQMQRPMEVIP